MNAEDQQAVGWAWTTGSPTGLVLKERLERGEDPAPTDEELVAIRAEWDAAGRPVPERHRHRTAVVLPDGATVTCVSFHDDDPYARDTAPAFGLYLDSRWSPPWSHRHVDWPDFGLPADPDAFTAELSHLLERARGGERVELGCLGGHGRTGTALAQLAVMTGVPPDDAVEWVRTAYCPKAVETRAQADFVASIQRTLPKSP